MASLKYSRQREAILEFLRTRNDHPTADVIYDNIRILYPNISLGTVYRNLSLLADIGKIRKRSDFDGADHFDGRTDRHCHFMCRKCHKIIDIENMNFDQILQDAGKRFSGEITDFNARFFGLCEDCMKEEKDSQNALDN